MKSAQEKGMIRVASIVRAVVPAKLEALIIAYPPNDPDSVASVMATCENQQVSGADHPAAVARAKLAAQAFIDKKPNAPGFNPES